MNKPVAVVNDKDCIRADTYQTRANSAMIRPKNMKRLPNMNCCIAYELLTAIAVIPVIARAAVIHKYTFFIKVD